MDFHDECVGSVAGREALTVRQRLGLRGGQQNPPAAVVGLKQHVALTAQLQHPAGLLAHGAEIHPTPARVLPWPAQAVELAVAVFSGTHIQRGPVATGPEHDVTVLVF